MDASDIPTAEGQGPHSSHRSLPEVMYSLSCLVNLYEVGLLITTMSDVQALRQQLLTHLRRAICAQEAAFLLYDVEKQRFLCVATQGVHIPGALLADALNGAEIMRQVLRGPGETVTSLTFANQRLALVTLSYNGSLLGIVTLGCFDETSLLAERGLLLNTLGSVSALLLHNAETQTRLRQETIEGERQRIAHDLHDGVLQQFAHMLHKLEFIQHLLTAQRIDAVQSELMQAHQALQSALDELHHTIFSWLPLQMTRNHFVQALQTFLQAYQRDHPSLEVRYTSNADGYISDLPEYLTIPLFRFIQEAFANVWKHAQATYVALRLDFLPSEIVAEVSDDGIGISPAQHSEVAETHLGLRSMRERIQQVGGTWQLRSHPQAGTTVRAGLPLKQTTTTALTPREREILGLVDAGLSNRTIAQQLHISRATVKAHIHHSIQKMHVKDRVQAATVASRHGWL